MIDRKCFEKIRLSLESYDKQREALIKKARVVLKLSKRLIYSLHRNNKKEAVKLKNQLEKEKSKLDRIAFSKKGLLYEGSYSEAAQEYVEAVSYYNFINKCKIPSISSLRVNEEDYLLGICDLTGELARRAVMIANKDVKRVEKIKDLVEDIFGEFLKLDLRNGNLRKKSDAIKWNLKKIEEVLYDSKRNKEPNT